MKKLISVNLRQKRQYLLLIVTIIALFVLSFLVLLIVNHGKIRTAKKANNKIIIQDPSQNIKEEDRWLERSEGRIDKLEQQLGEEKLQYNKLRQTINELNENLRSLKQNKENLASQNLENLQHKKLIDPLPNNYNIQENINIKSQDHNGLGDVPPTNPFLAVGENTKNKSAKKILNALPQKIEEINANLVNENNEEDDKISSLSSKNYLPSGSYAPAIIISGVDASVGISSQSDPRPMLFRITDQAISASKGDIIHKTDIEGCLVTGAAYGDLSSEKVFIRLLKMT